MSRMKAVLKEREGVGAQLKEVPVPDVGMYDVRVRVKAAAICGSDVDRYFWKKGVEGSGLKLPVILGHEFSGVVEKKGDAVTRLAVGDKVAGETHIPCGTCYQCLTGRQHICQNLKILGKQINGCFAEYITVPEICAWKVSEGVSFEEASVLEPLGVAVHAVSRGRVSGQKVVVIGCGPIGILAAGVAQALGALTVSVISRTPEKLELAARVSGAYTINSEEKDPVKEVLRLTDGYGAGVVIELSGSPPAIKQGFSMLRKGGTMVLSGVPQEPVELDLRSAIIYKQADVLGMHGREMFSTWVLSQDLILSKKIDLSKIITRTYALEEFDKAFQEIESRRAGKFILIP